MLDRISSQVNFSRVYILALIVNFSRAYLERLASRVYILVEPTLYRDRERLALLVYLLILHPCFASLFYLSLKPDLGRDILMLEPIHISRVYSLLREINTYFTCLFFETTSFLCESIFVELN